MRVVVVGGAGFLGSFVVRLLSEYFIELQEILVLDIHPLSEDVKSPNENISIRWVMGDIRDKKVLLEAFEGVDAVFHVAAIIELGNFPDCELMNSVNVDGTRNVVEACVAKNVRYLVYTGTSEMGRTYSSVENLDEDMIDDRCRNPKSRVLLRGYTNSKQKAESLVLNANGRISANGRNHLRTISLRPVGIYGEGDKKFVPTFILSGKRCFSLLPQIGFGDSYIQRVYVGNVAWIHVLALRFLMSPDYKVVWGQSFIVADDTPLSGNFQFMKPFVEPHRVKILPIRIPMWLVFIFLCIVEFLFLLLSPICKIPLSVTKEELYLACTTCYYDTSKAKNLLQYKPLYSAQESMKRSFTYYSTVDLYSIDNQLSTLKNGKKRK